MAEGVGFEPTTPVSQGNRLAGGRTRPLCDPSKQDRNVNNLTRFYYITIPFFAQIEHRSRQPLLWSLIGYNDVEPTFYITVEYHYIVILTTLHGILATVK